MKIKKVFNKIINNQYLLLLLIVIITSVIYINYSIIKHLAFQTHAFDLGIYTQISWLYSQNETSFSTLKHMPLLADHFEPILWIISPLYSLFPTPITLLIIQNVFVSLSAIPLYLIALNKTKSRPLSFLLIISYLTSIGIINAVKFEFHTTTLSVLPIALILFAWVFEKWKLYALTLLFGFLVKEDVSIMIFGLGIYQFIIGQRKLGIITIVTSASYFILIKFFLMPFIWYGAAQGYIASSLLPLTSPLDIIILLITRPMIFLDIFFNSSIKQHTFSTIYQPFAFLPLISPLSWLTAFPLLYLRFSATSTHFWTHIFHYNANLMPFITVSTILAIKNWRLPAKPLIILFSILLTLNGLSPNSMLWESMQKRIVVDTTFRSNMLQKIPPTESVSAQSPLVPHLANRTKIYMYPELSDANYIILDTSLEPYPIDRNEIVNKINEYRNSKYWQLFAEDKSVVIFEKKQKLTP